MSRCWLDPIIDSQAKHYGVSREKFVALMSNAASVQEDIDTYKIDEPGKENEMHSLQKRNSAKPIST